VIESQIAVSKRECHPPVIWVLAAENFRQLQVHVLGRIKGLDHCSFSIATNALVIVHAADDTSFNPVQHISARGRQVNLTHNAHVGYMPLHW
jgi:hypothetical protein